MRSISPFYIGSQFFLMLFFSLFTSAQLRDNAGTARVASFKLQQQLNAASPYKNLQWRNVGPDLISGRVTEVAGIPGNKNIIFASFATGGFWKTVDAGENWMPLTDQLGTLSIGAFALAPSNPDIIYLGTGESNILRASLPGMGAYKSIDGGKTWTSIGLTNTGTRPGHDRHFAGKSLHCVPPGCRVWVRVARAFRPVTPADRPTIKRS